MVPLLQNVGQNIALDLRDLLQRGTAHAPGLRGLARGLKRQQRFVPPGFVPLALAGSLFIAVAGVHELVRERGRVAPRSRTHLRITKLAYANRSQTAP